MTLNKFYAQVDLECCIELACEPNTTYIGNVHEHITYVINPIYNCSNT